MANGGKVPALLHGLVHDFQSCWKQLVLTDVAFKLIAFVLLTPLAALFFRFLVSFSGSGVLSDQDILMFLLRPAGWAAVVFGGAIGLGVTAFEQAALTAIVYAHAVNRKLGVIEALGFAAANAWVLLQVTVRIAAWSLLASVPFLAVAAVVYSTLLGDYDINYYLSEKPPAFATALAIGVLLAAALAAAIFRLFTGWFFALPLVLFESVSPSRALRLSKKRARGHRLELLYWMIGWLGISLLASTVASGVLAVGARWFLPPLTGSFQLLTIAIGVVLLLWASVIAAVNLLSTTTFAVMLCGLYRQTAKARNAEPPPPNFVKSSGKPRGRITPRRLTAATAVGFTMAGVAGSLAVRSVPTEDPVKIMAHRGASNAAPENTMVAIQRAIREGADWVEIDVQETADGNVVVFHDSDFMKVAGVDLKVWDATLDDLAGLDIGGWFAPEFQDQRVPTLAEVLDVCKGKVGVNIELKYYGHDEQLEERVAQIVDSRDMAAEILLMSLKMDGVKKMKSLRPDWQVGLLMSVSAGNLNKLEADFLAVNASFATRSLVRSAHHAEKEIYVWTVNDAPTMSRMIGLGVDGLITDKPELLRSVLQRRAQLSGTQRLLLKLAGAMGAVSTSNLNRIGARLSVQPGSRRSADASGGPSATAGVDRRLRLDPTVSEEVLATAGLSCSFLAFFPGTRRLRRSFPAAGVEVPRRWSFREGAGSARKLGAAAAIAVGTAGCDRPANDYVPPPPPDVTVMAPVVQPVTEFLEENGETEAVERAEVRSRVRGFVEAIEFDPGQTVDRGMPLYQIEDDEYRASVESAKAELALADAAIAVADSEVQAAETEVNRSRRELARQESLLAEQATSQSEADGAGAAKESAEAGLAAAKSAVKAAQARRQQASAKLSQAELSLSYTVVKAPIAGRVTKTDIKRGNLVDNGTELAAVVDDSRIYANFSVSDRQLLAFRESAGDAERGRMSEQQWQRVPVWLQRETDAGFPFVGRLDYVDQEGVEGATGTLSLRAVFENPDGLLFPGLFVRIRVPIRSHPAARLVPARAVLQDREGPHVWLIGAQNRVERRAVRTGQQTEGWVVITEGLDERERFVVEGLQRARPGVVVNPLDRSASVDDLPSAFRQPPLLERQPAGIPPGLPSPAADGSVDGGPR